MQSLSVLWAVNFVLNIVSRHIKVHEIRVLFILWVHLKKYVGLNLTL